MSELSDAFSQIKKEKEVDTKLGAISEMLERNGIDISEVGSISRISLYQQASKDTDGDVQVTDLVGVQINPKWEEGPEWPVVQPADPVVIKAKNPSKTKTDFDWKCAVIFPDPQIGFRRYEDGTLDPFHDESAMSVALQVASHLQNTVGVDLVVNLGDFIDMPEHSRYTQEASFAQTTQLSINRGHYFLAEQRATCPDARIILLEGNHDNRLNLHTTNNAKASFGLKRAGNPPEKWPVLSVPFLLRLDDLGVEFFDKYPAEQFWINSNLRAIHGDKANSSGSTASQWANKYPHISTVFGHIHRIEAQYKTVFNSEGPIRSVNISPGCLCRVDGAVPSTKSGVGSDGRPGVHWEDWQQGLAVIWYKDTGEFRVELIHIMDGVAVYNGVEYSAEKE